VGPNGFGWVRSTIIWVAVIAAVVLPIAAAAVSPLLAWREPVYILAGFAGIFGMTLLLVQPLLAAGKLPGLSVVASRRGHRWVGVVLALAVLIHVAALWITSPPDVIGALSFASPTPFSVWGVIAMWAVFATALLAVVRRRLRLRLWAWHIAHTALGALIVLGTIVHSVLIDGTMEAISKVALSVLVVAANAKVIFDMIRMANRRRSKGTLD
jgi:predicted ferric reductase